MPAVLPAAARGCAAVVSGVRRRTVGAIHGLLAGGGATASGVGALADDVVRSSLANSEAVAGLVRTEVERSLGRLGLATADEVRTLSARLAAVEESARATAPTPTAARRRSTRPAPSRGPRASSNGDRSEPS